VKEAVILMQKNANISQFIRIIKMQAKYIKLICENKTTFK